MKYNLIIEMCIFFNLILSKKSVFRMNFLNNIKQDKMIKLEFNKKISMQWYISRNIFGNKLK